MGANLKALWAKIKAQFADIWNRDKGLFILVAILAIIVKFRDILISLLLNSGKRVEENAKKDDSKLAQQETDLKAQSDALVQKSEQESAKQEEVTDDWNRKS